MIGERVKIERLKLGIRQIDLARTAHVGLSHIGVIESNQSRSVTLHTAKKLAKALNIDLNTIGEPVKPQEWRQLEKVN